MENTINATAVITLLTDWNTYKYQTALRAKDVKRAKVFTPEYKTDSPDNRYYLAMEMGRNNLPAVVLDYSQLKDKKGKAPILYTVTREDFDAYLQDAADRDARQEIAYREAQSCL
jgi:hypothetical protein